MITAQKLLPDSVEIGILDVRIDTEGIAKPFVQFFTTSGAFFGMMDQLGVFLFGGEIGAVDQFFECVTSRR